MKKKTVYALLLALTVASMTPVTAFADEVGVDQELIDASQEPIMDGATEATIVESAFTTYSDATSAMICVNTIMPELFTKTAYAQIKNRDTGVVYNLTLYADNNYSDRCYVPAGNYSFVVVGVVGDNTNTYSFDFPTDPFFVEAKQSAGYEVILNDFDRIDAELKEPYTLVEVPANEKQAPEEYIDEKVESDFEVIHTGTGLGTIGVTGEQDAEYELIIKITESGILEQSKFVYSLNNGRTWSEPATVPLAGYYNLRGTGLTINFHIPTREGASFVAEDIYECYIQDPATEIIIKHDGNGPAEVTVTSNHPEMRTFSVLETMGANIQVKVLKEGNFGSAVWQISKDGGTTWGPQEYAKEEVVITSDTDATLSVTLHFEANNAKNTNMFQRDDVYHVYAERTANNSDVVAITILFIIGAAAGIGGYMVNKKLKAAIPSASAYELRK